MMAVAAMVVLWALGSASTSAHEQGRHVAGPLALTVTPSGSVRSLGPADGNFSFVSAGSAFGAVTLRARPSGGGAKWSPAQTARPSSATPLPNLPAGEFAASTQPIGPHLVLEQHWAPADGAAAGLKLTYKLTNNGSVPLEIGLGISMPANEQTGGNLATLAATASFADPYVGGEHAYLSMTRLTGRGGVLMVMGENQTSFEAFADQWSPLGDPKTGTNAWIVHSRAFADTEWKEANGSWVNATSATIPPGGTILRSFLITLAEGGVQHKAATLRAAGHPVVVAVPGFVVATDMTTVRLFVQLPSDIKLESAYVVNDGAATTSSAPSPPCMTVGAASPPNSNGWIALPLSPIIPHCRCRVELRYSDGSFQVASYYVLPPLDAHLATFGSFQASKAYYDDDTDPFGRSPSVMPFNRDDQTHVLHDPRNFIVGLSDEGGAGANVGFAIKQLFSPVQEEVAQLDRYINSTLFGVHCPAAPAEYRSDCSLQDHATNGEDAASVIISACHFGLTSATDTHTMALLPEGIKASLFWTNASATWDDMSGMPGYKYEPEDFTGWKWDRERAYSLFRAYNYPHQTVVYHSMYRLARDNPTVSTSMPAVWYLKKCADTVRAAWSREGGLWYMQQGLMAGSVWVDVLNDLELEAAENASMFADDAVYVREVMANRTLPGRGMGGPGSLYFSSEVCPKSDNSPFQTCNCTNCTDDPTSNPCRDAKNMTTGVRLQCKSWADNPLPYGSEFSWDSTGQEEAYMWGRFFNQSHLADTVLNAVLAYDPSTPSWAYNGAALSYGDVGNNGYDPWNSTTHHTSYPLGSGSERVSGHYRAALNAVPLVHEYKRDPDAMYLLRLAIGGITNCLPNIDQHGATSMGFHLSPANLKFDSYSGDWGVGFFAAARHAGAFLVDDPELGQVCFLCDLEDGASESRIVVKPRDAWHKKLFIGSMGVEIISETGRILKVEIVPSKMLVVTFEDIAQQPLVSVLRLRVEQPAIASGNRPALVVAPATTPPPPTNRGAWEIVPAASGQTTTVKLSVAPAS